MRHFCLFLFASSLALAQSALGPDAKNCQDSKIINRMPGCRILRCKASNFNQYVMPVARPAGKPIEKRTVEGEYEEIAYQCPNTTSPLEISRNVENAFKAAGFQIPYQYQYGATRFYVTARKGPQWAYMEAFSGNTYTLYMVKEKEMEQALAASADGWINQINQTGKVSVYGINFDTGKATITPDSEKVLAELFALLQKQPDWSLLVAGHTDNTGSDAVNVPLSRQRAESVINWLGAKGIDKSRLVAAGFGSKRPVADNATEDGKAKNRRVDLIKLY
jgi:OOP family OmpA-OmpF porin